MRIATWNCCRGPSAKKLAAASSLGADLVVLTESALPPRESAQCRYYTETPDLGITVMGAPGWTIEPLGRVADLPRYVIPFRISGRGQFTLIAVWALAEPRYAAAIETGLRAYGSMLSSGPCIVAGDFNTNASYKPTEHPNHQGLVARLEAAGLSSCYHQATGEPQGKESLPTYYHQRKRTQPFHIDHCFVPSRWLTDGVKVDVLDDHVWESLSDHRPLVVEFQQTEFSAAAV